MSAVRPLSPIDHVFTGRGSYPIEFAFAYSAAIDAERLARSLRAVLVRFPAVSSRLVRLADGRYGLEPSPEGCVFETAACDDCLASSEARGRRPGACDRHGPDGARFVPPVATREGEPLARVRLTRTRDGCVLGVGLSHAVADGFSYFAFLAAWSAAFHGRPTPPFCHDRRLLAPDTTAGLEPSRLQAADRSNAEATLRQCGLFLDGPRPAPARERLRWTRRLFPRGELSELLAGAQAGCALRLSYNDVLAAWLWRNHVPAWSAAGEPRAWLSCPVDVRRLLPGFPATYFGCAVALASAEIELARLCEAKLPDLARRVRDAVAAVDATRMRRTLTAIDALRRAQGLGALERLHVVHPRAGLLVTNLSRLPVREIVFDAGPPVGFEMPAPAERCAVVLPGEDGLDVRVCEPTTPEAP